MVTSPGKGVDPATNPKLQQLISQLDEVDSEPAFIRWRSSFLKVYRKHLDTDGILNAKDANYRLVTKLSDMTQCVDKVKALLKSRNIDIQQRHVTAQGRRGLTDLAQELQVCIEMLETGFMPTTQSDEDRLGYDKFELASTLIEDGFHGHAILLDTQTYLQKTTEKLTAASMVDDSFRTIVDRFVARTKTIVDVLEDLGLYRIMVQCVGIVYKDVSKRPRPTPPEPPVEVDDDDDPGVSGGQRVDGHLKSAAAEPGSTRVMVGPDGKKKKGKKVMDSESGADREGRKGSRTQGPILEQGAKGQRSNRSDGPSGHPRPPRGVTEEEEEEEEKEEEEEEPPPPQEGGGGEPEMLIIFDPKTNMISKINRAECGAKCNLLIDVTKEGKDAYQGLVDDELEKQSIIWLLKKLEKTKPKEESWLEAIKREKAASPSTKIKGKIKMDLNAPKSHPTKKTSTGAKRDHNDRKTAPSSSASGKVGGVGSTEGFRNPMATSSSSSSATRKKKSTVEDFQGLYKKAAAKPDSGGWKKIS